jgi:hypothetical protein
MFAKYSVPAAMNAVLLLKEMVEIIIKKLTTAWVLQYQTKKL